MRRIALIVTLVACLLAYTAEAVAKEKLTATPSVVSFGQPLTIKGRGWPVIEFCSGGEPVAEVLSQLFFAGQGARPRERPFHVPLDAAPRASGCGQEAGGCADALRERQRRVAGDHAGDRSHPHRAVGTSRIASPGQHLREHTERGTHVGARIIRWAVPAALLAAVLGHGARRERGEPEAQRDHSPADWNGYKLTVSVGKSGKTGRLKLTCPDGKSLGETSSFDISKKGKFTAKKRKRRKKVFSFSGRFDQGTHVVGSGSVRSGKCGGSAPDSFSQGAQGQPRMLTCPQTTVDTPFPANTPFTYTGVLPNAAQGTKLRIEYTIPNSTTGLPAVAHVTTDIAGGFSDVHAFPPAGFIYGAAATPRFPDDPLGTGQPCPFEAL